MMIALIHFRMRMSKDPPMKSPIKNKMLSEEDVKNVKMLDPRNPKSKMYKQPSKSIPSKCS